MEVKKFIEENFENMKSDLKELVSFNSVYCNDEAPFGSTNRKVLDKALSLMEEKGLRPNNVDYYAGFGETGQGDKIIGILAHLDIVPAGEGWDSDPFTMIEKDGYVFGRGVSDDKGAAVASMYALKYLIDEGYTVIDCDMNAGTKKGCYIFLGYKTTTNFNEAISGFYLGNKYPESVTVDGLGTGYLAPYTGDDFFKSLPGNLNRGCGAGKGIYLYYFKNAEETGRAVSKIEIVKGSSAASRSIPHDSKLTGDLNQGAGGYYVYMCIGTKGVNDGVDVSLVNKMVETDQSYYPYCYTLGCKVSTYVTTQGVNNESTIKKSKNWTVEEINEFFARMKHWYMKDEFRSAGLYIGDSLVFTYEDNWLGKNHCVYIRQISNDRAITGVTNDYIGYNYDWTQGYIYFLMRY